MSGNLPPGVTDHDIDVAAGYYDDDDDPDCCVHGVGFDEPCVDCGDDLEDEG